MNHLTGSTLGVGREIDGVRRSTLTFFSSKLRHLITLPGPCLNLLGISFSAYVLKPRSRARSMSSGCRFGLWSSYGPRVHLDQVFWRGYKYIGAEIALFYRVGGRSYGGLSNGHLFDGLIVNVFEREPFSSSPSPGQSSVIV